MKRKDKRGSTSRSGEREQRGKPLAPPQPEWVRRVSRDERLWITLSMAALVPLVWSCRGAPFGVPVADDYDFLYWLRFHPFNLFDSMGTTSFWRPLGRQVYFLLVQRWLFSAPWLVSILHAALLAGVALLLYRVARRTLSPPLAAAAASFPLLAEPARVLLVWPSGGSTCWPCSSLRPRSTRPCAFVS